MKLDPNKIAQRYAYIAGDFTNGLAPAYVLSSAIRDAVADIEIEHDKRLIPDFALLKAVVPLLEQGNGILFSTGIEREDDDLTVLTDKVVGAGAILFFDDGSFLHCDNDAILDLNELSTSSEFCFDAPFTKFDEIVLISATKPVLEQHPDLEAWAAEWPEDSDEDLLITLQDIIENEEDPFVGDDDLADEQSWEDDEIEDLETHVVNAAIVLGIDRPADITVWSGVEADDYDDAEDAYVEVDGLENAAEIASKLKRILAALVNLDQFVGHSWEYADGAIDRRSGFSKSAQTLVSLEFDPADISNHERIRARPDLTAALQAADVSIKDINELIGEEAVAAA